MVYECFNKNSKRRCATKANAAVKMQNYIKLAIN